MPCGLWRIQRLESDCADYSDDLTYFGEQIFQEKSLYSCSFDPIWTGAGSVLDGYRGGHAAAELQARGWTVAGDPGDLSAVNKIDIWTLEVNLLWLQSGPCGGDLECRGPLEHHLDQPVLVGVVEVAQDREERRHGWMFPVVRLNALDGCLDWNAEFLYAFPLRTKVLAVVGYREGATPLVGRWIRLQFVNGNSVDEVIERGPEIVNRVPKNQRPALERRRLQDRNDDAVTRAVAVHLSRNCIGAVFYPGIKFLIQKACVFVRPLDLGKDAIQFQHEQAIARTSNDGLQRLPVVPQ